MPDVNHEAHIEALARLTGFSADAVTTMMRNLEAGGGRMAQFDHREFGGPGQWMRGGMLMTSDFSDHALQRRITHLCNAILERFPVGDRPTTGSHQSQYQSSGMPPDRSGMRKDAWWPAALGDPDTSGAQNDMQYAWFAEARRLAINTRGDVTLYDTGDHRIGGVAQQQGGLRSLEFASQHGAVDVGSLPVVDGANRPSGSHAAPPGEALDPFRALEQIGALHGRGILSDEEFAAKKAELLARI